MKLTDKIVAALPAPAKGNKLTYDDQLTGFAARVTAAGARSFVLNYRSAGRERRITIGQFPAWSTSAAREQAKRWKRDVDLGADPLAVREADRPKNEGLFEARAEQFLEHGRRKRGLPLREATKKEYRRALLTYAKPLHGAPLAEIRRGEIASLIRDVATVRGEVTAKNTRAAFSRLYSWAIANGHAEVNPVTGTESYSTPKRSRVLNDAELRALWAATAEPSDFSLIVRLCLWTGCRRSEAGGMAWSELDGGLWAIPGQRTKNGRPLVLPLPRQAVEALGDLLRTDGREPLFGRGAGGFEGWSDAKERLDAKIKLTPWTLHDTRRTVETRMAGLGIAKEIVNKILNHGAGPVTEAYDWHDYLPEKRAALQKWADALDQITGAAPANVVPLRRSGS
jgi:integrase